MSAHGLADALGALGVRARVEAREALAIVTVYDPAAMRSLRDRVLTLAKEHGFKHVAVELGEAAEAGAPLHRD